jgi:hypothetical protein
MHVQAVGVGAAPVEPVHARVAPQIEIGGSARIACDLRGGAAAVQSSALARPARVQGGVAAASSHQEGEQDAVVRASAIAVAAGSVDRVHGGPHETAPFRSQHAAAGEEQLRDCGCDRIGATGEGGCGK